MPTHANKSYGWIKREGKLGGPGYTKKTTAARHRILAGVVKKYGYRSALGSIMALERSTQISAAVRKVLVADRVWLRETYGAAATKRAAAPRTTRRRSIPSHSRVPAAPRSRVEIRELLARAGFRLLGTGKSVSYTARGERGPRIIAPFPKTLTAARALIKRAKAGGRSSAAAPRRVPSVARRSRQVRAATSRTSREWSAARGSSYPTRKPGESDQSYWRRVNAWTLAGVKDATRRHAAKYPGFAAWMKKQPKQRGGYNRLGEYVDLNTGGSILTPGDYRDKYAREVKGEPYARYNPRLPMGATKYMSVYAAVPTLVHDSIWQQRQKVADIYRSRKGGYFVIYTVGPLPHTIVDNEGGTLKSTKDEVVAYITGTTDILRAKGKNDYRALRFVLAKGEKTPDLKLMLNGRSECGYHGVPTIRGECVVCAYEADVR